MRNSLHNTWKNALVLDWIPQEKAKAMSVLQFYVGLRWTKTIEGLQRSKQELNSIYDILNVIESNNDGSVMCQKAESPKERSGAKKFWQKLIPKKLLKMKRIWPGRGSDASLATRTGPSPDPNVEQRPVKIFIEG